MSISYDTIINSGYDFFFLVVDKYLNISLPQLPNFYSIYDPSLSTKNSGYLLSQKSIQDFIRLTVAKSNHKVAIIPFKPSAKIEFICKQNNWLVVANPTDTNRFLEDKIKFLKLCQENNLPTVPSMVQEFSETSFQLAQKLFGQKIVIQTHFGWAGNCSYLTKNFLDVDKKIPHKTTVKYSKYLSGYSLTNNCCLTRKGLIQSPPGIQYTGLPRLTNNPLATVGRQWPCFAPTKVQKDIYQLTNNFSKILTSLNYRGCFGLDFLVSDNKVFLLECNPRLTASFALYTNLEVNQQVNPQFFHHIAEFTNLDLKMENTFNLTLIGSEITSKNDTGTTINKFTAYTSFSDSPKNIKIPESIMAKVL